LTDGLQSAVSGPTRLSTGAPPPTVQRVQGTTLVHPEQSFTPQELLRRAASGRRSAQQQIDRLAHAGVLVVEPRRGRQRSIRANTEFFLYPELRSIALKTFGLIAPIREALQVYADRIEEAFIFGSVNHHRMFEEGRFTGERREHFDMYLPVWPARHSKQFIGALCVAGVAFAFRQWLWAAG
jgi:hypothetical protein